MRRSVLVQALESYWTISDTFRLKKGHVLLILLCSLAPFSSEYNFLRSVRQGDFSPIADVHAPLRMYNKPLSLSPVPSLHQISEICLIFHKITKDHPLRWNPWQVEFLINFLNLKIKICSQLLLQNKSSKEWLAAFSLPFPFKIIFFVSELHVKFKAAHWMRPLLPKIG